MSLDKRIKRGKESWDFIYLVFAILLAIVTFIISILPISWQFKVIIFFITFVTLILLCLFNAWFQNKLIGLKIKFENSWKKI